MKTYNLRVDDDLKKKLSEVDPEIIRIFLTYFFDHRNRFKLSIDDQLKLKIEIIEVKDDNK